jgi:CheY-like chemotaxis protein
MSENVVFAECHSTDEALTAIGKHKPDVIFLDHSLTEGGEEGLEIARGVQGIKIYSTTANTSVVARYAAMGIEHIRPTDLKKFHEIIERQ